tara:strand:- start:2775 stop:4109 length:1335 start_codon:yes stop_codon:yes gene_type:complete
VSWPKTKALPYFGDSSLYFSKIKDMPFPVWLDSGSPGIKSASIDILAADPVETLKLDSSEANKAIGFLRSMLGERKVEKNFDLPFCGAIVGFIGYEIGRAWSGMQGRSKEKISDDLFAGLYEWAIIVDHQKKESKLINMGFSEKSRNQWSDINERLMDLNDLDTRVKEENKGKLKSNDLSFKKYEERFEKIKDYIYQGDIYQVNFTRRFSAHIDDNPLNLYKRLRRISPAPFGAFFDLGEYQILSNSPEQFLSLKNGVVKTKPIKGTRPRGKNPEDDSRLLMELTESEKDKAENLMIVDLLRNDLGRVCIPGSIRVPELFKLKTYAMVHHLVSTVTGRLAKGNDAFSLLQACFPGGSITGAPKYRAMQIIDELENQSRDIYCGTIFKLGHDGSLDSSISIRTMLYKDCKLFYWSGGGIVSESDCISEYQESLDKAAAFFELVEK